MFGPLGIFKECHSVVPPDPYFQNCVYDMCATDGQVGALCQAIESYADMCASKGVSIAWRNNTFCRKFVFVLTVVQCQNCRRLVSQAAIKHFQILSKSLFSLQKSVLQRYLICMCFFSFEVPPRQSVQSMRFCLSPTHLPGSCGPWRLLRPSLRGGMCLRPWPHPQWRQMCAAQRVRM